jgi:hypothetical protein
MKGSAFQLHTRIAKLKCYGYAETVTGLNQLQIILSRVGGAKYVAKTI